MHVDRSIEINPTYAASHWNMALILARQAKSDEAYEIVDQGLQQRPIYLAGVNAFAWLLATSPDERVRKPTGAEELARRCCIQCDFRLTRTSPRRAIPEYLALKTRRLSLQQDVRASAVR
jgi:hypothetical protein